MSSTARRSIIPQSARGGGQAAQARGAREPANNNQTEQRQKQEMDEEIKAHEADNENEDDETN